MRILFILKQNHIDGGPSVSHKRIIDNLYRMGFTLKTIYIPEGSYNLKSFLKIFDLKSEIKKFDPQIIHIVGLELIGFYSALLSKSYRKAKVILAIHGFSQESLELKKNLFKKLILNFLQYLTLLMVDYFYCVSDYVNSQKFLKKHYKKNKGVLYNLLNTTNISNKLRNILNINTIISVGRIEKEKGFHIISKIIQQMENYNVKFLIIGDGKYLSQMKNDLRNYRNVSFTGYKINVEYYLRQSSIFLTSSFHETFGMAIAEAGSYGLALIASNVGGIPEIVVDGKNGFLIDSFNPSNYIEKILILINNQRKLSQFSRNSYKLIRSKFDGKKTINKLISMYKEILNG